MFDYAQVRVERSETTMFNVHVPQWEVPILQAGGSICQIVGAVTVRKALPSAADEFERLRNKYNKRNDSGEDTVAAVYGGGQRGIDALAQEIDKVRKQAESVYGKGAADTKVVAERPRQWDKPAAIETGDYGIDDPLAGLGLEEEQKSDPRLPNAVNFAAEATAITG